MKFISAAETEQLLDWPSAISAMIAAYSSPVDDGAVPGRLISASGTSWLRCLPAIPSIGRYMGTKQISRTKSGRLAYLITLFDKESGELSYIIDALALTGVRTAATSAAAVTKMFLPDEANLAILGSGLEASKHLEAIVAVKKIKTLRIYSPTAKNRERFAIKAQQQLQIETSATDSPEAAVEGADIVIAAARSRGEHPILQGSWLGDDTLVVSIGSTIPAQREVDASVVSRCNVIVADVPEEVRSHTGDMIAAAKLGINFEEKLFSLNDLMRAAVPSGCKGIRMFKSVGSALQDIACAELVATRAEGALVGKSLDIALEIKQSIGLNT